jgi:hypothetical protein
MLGLETGPENKNRACRQRRDTVLIFDPSQKVPDTLLKAIIDEWLVPCIVDQFVRKRNINLENPE